MSKRFAALARVSSREQEREGFSLEVQDDALHRYAKAQGGAIVKCWRIAETASPVRLASVPMGRKKSKLPSPTCGVPMPDHSTVPPAVPGRP